MGRLSKVILYYGLKGNKIFFQDIRQRHKKNAVSMRSEDGEV